MPSKNQNLSESDKKEIHDNGKQLAAQIEPFRIVGYLLRGSKTALLRARTMLARDYGYNDIADMSDDEVRELTYRVVGEDILSVERESARHSPVVVLCTGGPHCEVKVGSREAIAVCYGWFGANEVKRKLTKAEYEGISYYI